ncbi:MAG: chorismate mutase [Candidatus Bathyarchaeia archaeon]
MEEILNLRKKIDEVDEKILHLLKERMEICENIGAIKKEHGFPVRNRSRENEKYKRIMEKALELGLDPYEVKAVYRKIIAMCIRVQKLS